jgi:Ca2+-binding RTX toxin-like protein
VIGSAFNDALAGDGGDNVLTGGKGNDVLTGGGGSDTAAYDTATAGITLDLSKAGAQNTVGAGTDTLFSIENLVGSAFNDKLTGDAGANTLDGGDGVDTLSYAGDTTGVSVTLGGGPGVGGDAGGDVFSNFENIIGGSKADQLAGDAGSNRLDGGAGDDTLTGGAGADVLIGGTGNADLALYGGATAVTVDLSTGKGKGGDAEGDTLSGIENVSGSTADDVLTGNSGANSLSGGDGSDTLSGGAGNDQQFGGTGDDLLTGGSGADALDGGDDFDTAFYAGSAARVTVNLLTGTGSGGDAHGDTLTGIEAVIGSSFGDTLTGGAGNDTLEGGAGNDALSGGAANDTAAYATASKGVTVNLSILVAQNTVGAGTDTLSGIENLTGSAFGDTLSGNSKANVLEGGAGNDTLHGGFGDDTASYANSAGAAVPGGWFGVWVELFEGAAQNTRGAGVDTLDSIENAIGSDFDDVLIGSTSDNVLQGRGGDDSLDGRDGNNTLIGGAGNDTLAGGFDNDVFVFDAAFGNDEIVNFGSGEDKVDFDNALFATKAAVVAAATKDGDDTLITFDAGNTVRLRSFNIADFDEDDVLLH